MDCTIQRQGGFFAAAKIGIPFRARCRSVLRTAASGPLQATLAGRHPGAEDGTRHFPTPTPDIWIFWIVKSKKAGTKKGGNAAQGEPRRSAHEERCRRNAGNQTAQDAAGHAGEHRHGRQAAGAAFDHISGFAD